MGKSLLKQRFQEETGLDENLNVVSFEKVKEKYHKWIYMEDELALDVVFATVIANRFSGDPVWLFYISPPGGGKSEILRALAASDEIYPLSSLTENTLISGLKAKSDPSLIPKLNGKILVIKDFTAILSIHREARGKIIGDLRDAFDGQCSKTFGTGEERSYESKFGLIAGVTPVIDKCWGIQVDLGERFLRFRIRLKDREKATERAMKNAGLEEEMRSELLSISRGFLTNCQVPLIKDVTIEPEMDRRIMSISNLLALARSKVSRNGKDGTIDYQPDPEVGTRVAKQLKLAGAGFTCIHNKDRFDEDVYGFIRRVCRDTLPSREAKILETLFVIQLENDTPVPTSKLGDRSGFPTETCKKVLEDFRLLKIVEREGKGTFKWRLTEHFYESSRKTGFLIPF